MAKKSDTTLSVRVKSTGTTKTAKELKTVEKAAKGVAASSNAAKRNLEGVSERAGRGAKDFSRMSQGMGGLVKTYATLAANVYALSSAFSVLEKSADFSSMKKSAEDLARVTGRDFLYLSENMKKASGAALSLQEALALANKAGTTPASNEQIVELTQLATKAAQTFGGTTTDAMNRFVDATLRGRTELVQKLGVVVNLDKAMEKYAATLGKGAKSLNEVERQQAIVNAIIEQGNKSLGGITIDPNPYQTLTKRFFDLAYSFGESTRALLRLDDIAIYFRDNIGALITLVGLFAASIGKKLVTSLNEASIALQGMSKQNMDKALAGLEKVKATMSLMGSVQKDVLSDINADMKALGAISTQSETSLAKVAKAIQFPSDSPKNLEKFNVELTKLEKQYNKIASGKTDQRLKDLSKLKLENPDMFAKLGADIKSARQSLDDFNAGVGKAKLPTFLNIEKQVYRTTAGFNLLKASAESTKASMINAVLGSVGPIEKVRNLIGAVAAQWKMVGYRLDENGKKVQLFTDKFLVNMGKMGVAVGALGGAIQLAFAGALGAVQIVLGAMAIWNIILKPIYNFFTKTNAKLKELRENTKTFIEESNKVLKSTTVLKEEQQRLADAGVSAAERIVIAYSYVSNSTSDIITKQREEVNALNGLVDEAEKRYKALRNAPTITEPELTPYADVVDSQDRKLEAQAKKLLKESLAQAQESLKGILKTTAEWQNQLTLANIPLTSINERLSEYLTRSTNLSSSVIESVVTQLNEGFKKGLSGEEIYANLTKDIKLTDSDAKILLNALVGSESEITNALKGYDNALKSSSKAATDFAAVQNRINQTGIKNVGFVDALTTQANALNTIFKGLQRDAPLAIIEQLNAAIEAMPEEMFPTKLTLTSGLEIAATGEEIKRIYASASEETKKSIAQQVAAHQENIAFMFKTLAVQQQLNKAQQDSISTTEKIIKLKLNQNISEAQVLQFGEEIAKQQKAKLLKEAEAIDIKIREEEATDNLRGLEGEALIAAQARINALKELANLKREEADNILVEVEGLKERDKYLIKLENFQKSVNDLELKRNGLLKEESLSLKQTLTIYNRKQELAKAEQNIQIKQLERRREILEKEIDSGDLAGEALGNKEQELGLLEQQLGYIKQINELTNDSTSAYRVALDYQIKIKNIVSSRLEAEKAIQDLIASKGLTRAARRLADLQSITLEVEKTRNEYEKQQLEIKNITDRIKTQEEGTSNILLIQTEGTTQLREQLKVAEINLRLQEKRLEYLQVEKALLKEINLAQQIEDNDPTGLGGLFSKEGIENAAHLFYAEFYKGTLELEPAMKVLAKGFSDTLNNSIESVVDSLTTYGFSKMGRALKEALITGLRETLAEVLSNNIKNAVGGLIKESSTWLQDALGIAQPDVKKAPEEILNNTLTITNTSLENLNSTLTTYLNKAPTVTQKPETPVSTVEVSNKPKEFNDLNITLGTTNTTLSTINTALTNMQLTLTTLNTSIVTMTNTCMTCKQGKESVSFGGETVTSVPSSSPTLPEVDSTAQSAKETADATNELVNQNSQMQSTLTTGFLTSVAAYYASGKDTKVAIVTMLAQVISAIVASKVADSFSFASGGVVKGGLGNRIPAYASGTITRGPEIALIGEGKNNEAVVPLPNNREIPVDLKGQNTSNTFNISQNFDFTNADKNVVGQLRSEARNIEDRTFARVFNEINKGGKYSKIVGRR